MTLVAHLSDLHLLEAGHGERRGLERFRLAYLSTGVRMDAVARRMRALAALREARLAGADHVLVTGDLTEDGSQAQYEVLSDVLADSGLRPDAVTLVPGNHDAYASPRAWVSALEGPLRAYARTSRAGAVTVLDDLTIKPISTVIEEQAFTLSLGQLHRTDVEDCARVVQRERGTGRSLLLAMHHPPLGLRNPVMNAIDGVRGSRPMRDLLAERQHVFAAHGHIHREHDRGVQSGRPAQVFSAAAARDGEQRVRYYRAQRGDALRPTQGAGDPGVHA